MQTHSTVLARMANALVAITLAHAATGSGTGAGQRKNRRFRAQFDVEYASGETGVKR